MKATARTIDPSLGPVEFPILQCDSCNTKVQEPYAYGWYQLFSLGNDRILARMPEETHFCGTTCLSAFVGLYS